jgi:hypothetical protein
MDSTCNIIIRKMITTTNAVLLPLPHKAVMRL